MKKGLITLMTVAIALVSVQAMAMAPTIHDLPSVVVGNQSGVASQAVKYVYIDAFDLNNFVYDDNTSTPLLKWSYEITGTPKYTINGDAIMNSAVDDPANPPANKIIAGPAAVSNTFTGATGTTYTGQDALNNTVTIRNIALYPYGGSQNSDTSAANQAWSAHVQPVTFWCSDGNLASSSTVLFWTDNHYNGTTPIGFNRLSGTAQWTTLKQDWLNATGSGNKLWHTYDPFFDHCTSHTINGSGVCFNVTASGQNWGSIQSPMPYFTMAANQVYKIRCTMNGSQTSVNKTPLWDFIVENLYLGGTQGLNLYGMDTFYVDAENGANTILSTTQGTEMTMYWAPTAFTTPQWTNSSTGLWSTYVPTPGQPAVPRYAAADISPALRFRVLDVDAAAGLRNDQKSGDICLQKVIVEAIGYGACKVDQANIVQIGGMINGVASAPKAAANPPAAPGNMIFAQYTGATASYTPAANATTPGWVTITPSSGASQQNELCELTPGTDLKNTFPTNEILDNWPIPWQSDKILRLQVSCAAPDALSAASPWDVMWLSIECPSNEISSESFTTARSAIGSPKQGNYATRQTYTMFYYTAKETLSSTANLHFLRWRIRFGNSSNLNWPSSNNTTNTGKVNVYTVQVDSVKFQ